MPTLTNVNDVSVQTTFTGKLKKKKEKSTQANTAAVRPSNNSNKGL